MKKKIRSPKEKASAPPRLTRGQEKMLRLLRSTAGKTVTRESIIAATGWKESSWSVYLSNGYYSDYLRPINDDTYENIASPNLSEGDFALRVTQSRAQAAQTYPPQAYHPFPKPIIDELEQLTREREVTRFTSERFQTLQAQIDRLVSNLKSMPAPIPGTVVAGARLQKILGKGNYGTVWEAIDIATDQQVAVKIFDSDRLGLKTTLYHFRRGVRAMEHLKECDGKPRGIVRLRHVEENQLAFSMDLAEAGDLTEIAARGWSTEKSVAVFQEVCKSVSFAHSHGVIHRDIKPHNVVMRSDGTPVLTDFDIADLLFAQTQSSTGTGHVAYAAPEELEPASRSRSPSATADVYSLGRLLYYLLLKEDLSPHADEVPRIDNLPSTVPDDYRHVIRKATMRAPEKRYQSVDELLADLVAGAGCVAVAESVSRARERHSEATTLAQRGLVFPAIRSLEEALSSLPKSHSEEFEEWNKHLEELRAANGDAEVAKRILLRPLTRVLGRRRMGIGLTILIGLGVLGWSLVNSSVFDRVASTEPGRALEVGSRSQNEQTPGSLADDAGAVGVLETATVAGVDEAPEVDALVDDSSPPEQQWATRCERQLGPDACMLAARVAASQGDDTATTEFYRRACEQGSGESCFQLGRAFAQASFGLSRNYSSARRYYERACELHSYPACAGLGGLFENGQGGDKNPALAFDYYARSCDGEHASGCDLLASAYRRGVGTDQSVIAARTAMMRAREIRSRSNDGAR